MSATVRSCAVLSDQMELVEGLSGVRKDVGPPLPQPCSRRIDVLPLAGDAILAALSTNAVQF